MLQELSLHIVFLVSILYCLGKHFVRLMPIKYQVVLYCIVSPNVSLTESEETYHLNSCMSRAFYHPFY